MENKCPICNKEIAEQYLGKDPRAYKNTCATCGIFYATENFQTFFSKGENKEQIYKIQGAIREKNLENTFPILGIEEGKTELFITVGELLKSIKIPQNPSQQIDKILENLAKKLKGNAGKNFHLYCQASHPTKDFPLGYAKNEDEFQFLLQSMEEVGYFTNCANDSAGYHFRLSLGAWERIEELKQRNIESNQGFVACDFKREKKIITAIEDGIRKSEFDPMAIKEKNYNETILSKALGEIRRSRFVVVDLTEESKSVFVEFGFSLGLDIPTILVVEESYWKKTKKDPNSKMEFYCMNYNIKKYKSEEDLKEIIEVAIRERIESR